MDLKKEILDLFESKIMREHIDSVFYKLDVCQLTSLIDDAMIDIKKKLALFKQLRVDIEMNRFAARESETESLDNQIKSYKGALANRRKSGGVFLVKEMGYDEDDDMPEKIYGAVPFKTFSMALRYIEKEYEENKDDTADENIAYWYEIEHWSSDINGNLAEMIYYTVLWNGTVVDFYCDEKDGLEVNIPHPFKAGDIVKANVLPFVPPRAGLILERGRHPDDCCYPSCLYMTRDGKYDIGALKHNSVFSDYHINIPFSPMYRIDYTDELAEGERIFKEIGEWINGDETKGTALWEYIFKTNRVGDGITYETLRNGIEELKDGEI